ncbi:MAG: hypothetical protein ACRD63_12240 [Pyrinomonadaceae bacterium]
MRNTTHIVPKYGLGAARTFGVPGDRSTDMKANMESRACLDRRRYQITQGCSAAPAK